MLEYENIDGVRFRPHQGIILFNRKGAFKMKATKQNTGFRPHQGIILFNKKKKIRRKVKTTLKSFRPHQGIILFNNINSYDELLKAIESVSVPIRGLFYLTLSLKQQIFTSSKMQKTAEIVNPPQKAL